MKTHFRVLMALAFVFASGPAFSQSYLPPKRISELPSATTPLADTEIAAIVQAGVTKQASVASLKIAFQGISAPATPIAGQFWFDTSGSPSWVLKQYDGSQWVQIGTLNTSAHTWTPVGGGGGGTPGKSVVVANGVLEATLPIQTATGASKTFATADIQYETRRSNSASAMTDTFPAAAAAGMVNGARITLNNVDASATDTITAGSGTTIAGNSTYAVPAGRSLTFAYDLANTAWRPTFNTGTSVLGPASSTTNNCPKFADNTGKVLADSGAPCGGSGSPGGSSGQLQYNNSGVFGGATVGNGLNMASGVLSPTYGGRTVTTTTDTLSCTTDAATLVTYNSASAVAVTVPQATGSCGAGIELDVANINYGVDTLTPTTSTINGVSSLNLSRNTSCALRSNGTNWEVAFCTAIGRYDLAVNFSGLLTNSQKFTFIADRSFNFPASLTNSKFTIGTNPTSTLTLTLNKNGSSIGSISCSTGGTCTPTFASAVTFSAGDILTIVGPGTADATGADISLTLWGSLN